MPPTRAQGLPDEDIIEQAMAARVSSKGQPSNEGVGLTLSSRIVELMGGHMLAASGAGTVVRLASLALRKDPLPNGNRFPGTLIAISFRRSEASDFDSKLLKAVNASAVNKHFVRGTVGMDRAAVLALFSDFLDNRDLTSSQIRFIETLVDSLASQGIVDGSALYEPPFSDVHAGGPDELFAGKNAIIEGISHRLKSLSPEQAAG